MNRPSVYSDRPSVQPQQMVCFYSIICASSISSTAFTGSIRCLRAATRKLEPVQQFRSRIDQTADTDNDKCRGAYSRRIEQRNQAGKQNQYRNHIKPPGTGIQRRAAESEAICCTPPITRINPNTKCQQIGKETGHDNQPQAKQQAAHPLDRGNGCASPCSVQSSL